MTVDELCKWLEKSDFKEGERLPSVRSIAASSGASTFTIFRAYKRLVSQGKVYSEQGNGYFWGQKISHLKEITTKEHVSDRLERLFLDDWKSGKISADQALPSNIKA